MYNVRLRSLFNLLSTDSFTNNIKNLRMYTLLLPVVAVSRSSENGAMAPDACFRPHCPFSPPDPVFSLHISFVRDFSLQRQNCNLHRTQNLSKVVQTTNSHFSLLLLTHQIKLENLHKQQDFCFFLNVLWYTFKMYLILSYTKYTVI